MRIPGAVEDLSAVQGGPIRYASGGDLIDAYLARPAKPGRYPAIIVIHEAFGLVEHERDVARRFANIGYVALAPDLYSRTGGPDPKDMAASLARMFALPDAQAIRDLESAAAFLRADEGTTGKIGCIGFCSGGRHTLLFACNTTSLTAAVDCWGGFTTRAAPDAVTTENRPKPVADMIGYLSCPLFLAAGEEDQNPSPDVARDLEERGHKAGKSVEVKVYKEAGHAFFADWRANYREKPAFELWADVVAFLQTKLGA